MNRENLFGLEVSREDLLNIVDDEERGLSLQTDLIRFLGTSHGKSVSVLDVS